MKNQSLFYLFLLFCFAITGACSAQNFNWKWARTANNPLLLYTALGYDYGLTATLGAGYHLPMRLPALVTAEYSFPAGKTLFDDFKSKLGVQVEGWHSGRFAVSARISGIYRQYTSDVAQVRSFGSEMTSVVGWYQSKWFVAGEAGFDKAISTHIRQGPDLRENYPGIRDGWYVPTGGNFRYGLQTGFSFGKNEVQLSAGKVVSQDFQTGPIIPFYFQLGYNRWF